MTGWFVSYETKATGRVHLVGPFENPDHAQTFYNGLVYTGGQAHERITIVQAEKP